MKLSDIFSVIALFFLSVWGIENLVPGTAIYFLLSVIAVEAAGIREWLKGKK